MPLFLCCHYENNCSSFGAVVLFPAVPNLYQEFCCLVHVEVEERYFQGQGMRLRRGSSDAHSPIPWAALSSEQGFGLSFQVVGSPASKK